MVIAKYLTNKQLMAEILVCQTSNQHPNEVSNELAKMLILFVNKYSTKGNWRGYSYIDEMRQAALLHLVIGGPKTPTPVVLRFDTTKSQNPFAYITQCIKNVFIKVLKQHQHQQDIRDMLLSQVGKNPSSGFCSQTDEKYLETKHDII